MSGRSWSRVQRRLRTAINKAACMRRWTNSAVISLLLRMVGSGRARKTSEVSYWHNTYKLARSHEVRIEKALTVRRSAKSCRVAPPSTRTHRPEGAQAGATQQTAVWGAQQKHSSVCKQEHICFQHCAQGKKNIVARKLDWSPIKVRVGARSLSPLSAGVIRSLKHQRLKRRNLFSPSLLGCFTWFFQQSWAKKCNIYHSFLE